MLIVCWLAACGIGAVLLQQCLIVVAKEWDATLAQTLGTEANPNLRLMPKPWLVLAVLTEMVLIAVLWAENAQ